MQALPHDVMEKVGGYLTRLQLHLGVSDWTTSAIRLRPSDWDIATQLTEQALEEWSNRIGFAPQLRTVEARYSWTVMLHCHHHDLATTARLGSIAKICQTDVSPCTVEHQHINTFDAAKLSGRVNKTFDWHKLPSIKTIYMDIDLIELLKFMKARRVNAPIHLE